MVKRIRECELLPPWYGMAWHDWRRNEMVCLPIGLNLLAGVSRGVYHLLKGGARWVAMNPRDAFEQGFHCGREIGQENRDD